MTAERDMRAFSRGMDEYNAGIQNGKNTWSLLMDALTPKPDPRADLVDLFEARAETHDDKSWIEVEEAVDLVMDREAEITDEQVEAAARIFLFSSAQGWTIHACARAALEVARGADS